MESLSMPQLPPLAFDDPMVLGLLAFLPGLWIWQWRTLRSVSRGGSLFLHSLTLTVLVLAAAGMHHMRPATTGRPLLILDTSRSMDVTQRRWMRELVTRRLAPEPSDPALVFATSPEALTWEGAEDRLPS